MLCDVTRSSQGKYVYSSRHVTFFLFLGCQTSIWKLSTNLIIESETSKPRNLVRKSCFVLILQKIDITSLTLIATTSEMTCLPQGGADSAPPSYLLQIAPKPFMTGYCHFFTFPQMVFEGYFWSKTHQNIFISGVTY